MSVGEMGVRQIEDGLKSPQFVLNELMKAPVPKC